MTTSDLKPWPYIKANHQLPPLSDQQMELLSLVRRWRALRVKDLVSRKFTVEELAILVDMDELYMVPTMISECIILGPAGRHRYGMRHDNRLSVDSVMNSAYMAYAVNQLIERDGWRLRQIESRGRYLMQDPEGKNWTVIGQARGHTSRSLRRVIRELRVPAAIQGAGILIITPDQRRTYNVERKNRATVAVKRVSLARLTPRRKIREQNDPLNTRQIKLPTITAEELKQRKEELQQHKSA